MTKEEQTEKPKKKQGKSKEEKANLLCKTYRFRVREKQVSSSLWQFIVQSVGNQRFVYNHFLNRMNQFWLQQITLKQELESQNKPLPEDFKTFLTRNEMEAELTVLKQTKIIKEITDENGHTEVMEFRHFLNDTHSQPLQSTIKQLSDAMAEFAKKKRGKPQFRKKGECTESVFYKQLYPHTVNRKKGYVILPGSKEKLPVHFHRTFKSREIPKTMTLKCDNGKWFICIQIEYKLSRKDHDKLEYNKNNVSVNNTLAYDLGVNKMIVSHEGDYIDYFTKTKLSLDKLAKRLIVLQRKLSHKYEVRKKQKQKFKDDAEIAAKLKYSSENYKKLQSRIQKLYAKIHRIKVDFLHKVSHSMSKSHTHIVREALAIPQMTKSARRLKLENDPGYKEKLAQRFLDKPWLAKVYSERKQNRKLLNKNWGMFNLFLEYKLAWNMGFMHKINPAYTSQTCSVCNHKSKDNRLSQSLFICQQCGVKAHADVNAARNILFKAFSPLREVVGTDIPQLKRINSYLQHNALSSNQTEILI